MSNYKEVPHTKAFKQTKQLLSSSFSNKLSNVRVLQKNIMYIIGLSSSLANKELLSRQEYLGQYGNALKIVINNHRYTQSRHGPPTYSAYVTYEKYEEASLAILAIDNIEIEGYFLRASYGTTKYCAFFLKNTDCLNKDCQYLHHLAKDNDTLSKEENVNKQILFDKQQGIAKKLARLDDDEYRKSLFFKESPLVPVFPSIEYVYKKEYLKENKTNNNTSEEIEYVLVKEPKLNRYRKRWNGNRNRKMSDWNKGMHINTNSHQDDYGFKRKMTYEIHENEETMMTHNDNNSHINNGTGNGNAHTLSLSKSPEKKNIFMRKEKSRFDFVRDVNDQENQSSKVDIPDSVYDYVNRKTTLLFVLNSLQEKESIKSDSMLLTWNELFTNTPLLS